MGKYYIRHTDVTKPPIEVDEHTIDESSLDIALFGRIRTEYGERLNQNLLNIMENFAVGSDASLVPPTPTPVPSQSATPAPSASPPPVTPTSTPTISPTPTPTAAPLSITLSGVYDLELGGPVPITGVMTTDTTTIPQVNVITPYVTINVSGGPSVLTYEHVLVSGSNCIAGGTVCVTPHNHSPSQNTVRFHATMETSQTINTVWKTVVKTTGGTIVGETDEYRVVVRRVTPIPPLSVSLSHSMFSQSGNCGEQLTTDPGTATIVGGIGPFTYAWTCARYSTEYSCAWADVIVSDFVDRGMNFYFTGTPLYTQMNGSMLLDLRFTLTVTDHGTGNTASADTGLWMACYPDVPPPPTQTQTQLNTQWVLRSNCALIEGTPSHPCAWSGTPDYACTESTVNDVYNIGLTDCTEAPPNEHMFRRCNIYYRCEIV